MLPFDLDLSRLGYVAAAVVVVIAGLSAADHLGRARAVRVTRRLIAQYAGSATPTRGEARDT